MGFLLKYASLSGIAVYACWSSFFSVNSVLDVLGDVHDRNYTTRIHLEDMVVGDNASLIYVSPLATELDPNLEPLPGYTLYWNIMLPVSSWFQPHVYQMVKLTIVSVSLISVLTCTLAVMGQSLYSCGHTPSFWLCHPTPLLLVELSLMLAMSQVMVIMFLGSPIVSGLMDAGAMTKMAIYFMILMMIFSLVGNHYKEEKRIAEEKMMEYETVVVTQDESLSDSFESDLEEQSQHGISNNRKRNTSTSFFK